MTSTNKKYYNIKIYACFKTLKKFNIGGAYPVKTRADIPIQKISIGEKTYFYIPGSSIKGVLRTSLIKIAGLLGYKDVNWRVEPSKIRGRDIITRLFGEPNGGHSKVYVEPVLIETTSLTLPHIKIKDSMRTVEEGTLFYVEYLPINLKFETYIYCNNVDKEEARAILAAIINMRFERIGKAGVLEVSIDPDKSEIPAELMDDPIIKTILRGV